MGNKQIHVQVTQADIDQAEIKKSSRCVVATTIARTIPDATRISVDVQSVRFTSGGERRVFLCPYPVAGYVVAFDAGEEIHPFNFRLRTDQEVIVRKRPKTEAGHAKNRATEKVRSRTAAKAKAKSELERVKADPTVPPAQRKAAQAAVKAANDAVVDAEQERATVIAAYEGQPYQQPEDVTKPKATPKVFKTGERHYGHRKLRINQQ